MVAGSFSLEGGQTYLKKEGHEQWWTLRCQVCGAGLPCKTKVRPSEFDVRGMTLSHLVKRETGVLEEMKAHVKKFGPLACVRGVCGLPDGNDGRARRRASRPAHDEG